MLASTLLLGKFLQYPMYLGYFCLVSSKILSEVDDDRKTYYDKNGALVVPVADQHIIDLYTRWIEQGLSSVISILATKE